MSAVLGTGKEVQMLGLSAMGGCITAETASVWQVALT